MQLIEILSVFAWILGISACIAIFVYFKTLVVVPFNEIHVISRGKKVRTYDGKGRYWYLPFLHGRTIIPKFILDVEPELIKLHDKDNLPFGVEISVKVQVTDPQKAAATLTKINLSTVSKVVEDTVMSAARSVSMERNIIDIMKKREEIETAIYQMVTSALSKVGLSAIIFDIKNIKDIESSEVIGSLERVKIAELQKNAKISEAIHNKESNVKIEQMKKEEDDARLIREQETTAKMRKVEEEKLKIEEQKQHKLAEIAKEKKMIEAKAEAESVTLRAQAESEAIKLKANAEAESIRDKGFAEADILRKKAEAMNVSTLAGQVKILEILSQAQVDSAGKIADALGKNNKIMYLPMNNNGKQNFLMSFMPQIDALLQSGLPTELVKILEGIKGKNKKEIVKNVQTQ